MLLPSLPLRFALILGLFATLCTARVGLAQKPPPDAVERMLARSDAVFSGRYTYTLLSGVDRTKKPIPFELIYSGPSWKRTEKQLAADVEMTFSEDLIKSGFDPKKVKPLQGYREITNVSHKGKFMSLLQIRSSMAACDTRFGSPRANSHSKSSFYRFRPFWEGSGLAKRTLSCAS